MFASTCATRRRRSLYPGKLARFGVRCCANSIAPGFWTPVRRACGGSPGSAECPLMWSRECSPSYSKTGACNVKETNSFRLTTSTPIPHPRARRSALGNGEKRNARKPGRQPCVTMMRRKVTQRIVPKVRRNVTRRRVVTARKRKVTMVTQSVTKSLKNVTPC